MAVELNNDNFQQEISSGVSLVDFWAEWCGPCQTMLPVLEQLSEKMDWKAKIAKINVDQNPDLASKFRVMSIPTILIFKDWELAQEPLVWVKSLDELESALNSHM